jgi:4-amino-4-deoxychorismate lyase
LAFAINDRIFLGEGLFETLKVEYAKPCDADLHWQRLAKSAQKLGISFDLSYEQWLEHLLQKIQQDNLLYGGIKVILSGGVASRGLAEYGQCSQWMLQTFEYTRQTQGLHLVSAPWLRDSANPVYQVKSINYLEAIFARRHAIHLGADDALFFNFQQHATETTCANLFAIHKQNLLTPPLADGLLAGITRSKILTFAQQNKISCSEVSLTKPMLEEADAVFVTNSLQGIQMISSLDGVDFASKHPLLQYLKSFLNEGREV